MPASSPAFIVGAAETPLGKVLDHSELSMVALAAKEALGEAGLRFRDVDALFTNYMGEEGSVQLGEYLGIQPRYAESSDMGGASFEFFIHHAMLAIAARRCDGAHWLCVEAAKPPQSTACSVGRHRDNRGAVRGPLWNSLSNRALCAERRALYA